MRVATIDNGGKSVYLQTRLAEAGHELVGGLRGADVLLIDCDWAFAPGRREVIAEAKAKGVRVAVYPHGGLPTSFVYDGLTDADANVDVRLEHGQGIVDIADKWFPQNLKQVGCGWLFSPTQPFAPVENPVKVLFAPQHPNMEMLVKGTSNGSDPGPALNQPVYKQLLGLGYELTVSYVGPPFRNGVYPHPKATLVENLNMLLPQTLDLIADADVVVAAGTVAAAAVALGKPVVMIGQTDLTDYVDGFYHQAEHADRYRDLFRYPIDAADGDLEELILQACYGDQGAAMWRERFIGDDGTARAVSVLEGLVGVSSSANVTIGGVTARGTGLGG